MHARCVRFALVLRDRDLRDRIRHSMEGLGIRLEQARLLRSAKFMNDLLSNAMSPFTV